MAKKTPKYKYNIITTQKGRTPLWTPKEAKAILDATERGEIIAVLRNDRRRVDRYVGDRYTQLTKDYGLTGLSEVSLMAAAIDFLRKSFPALREYITHVDERMEAGEEYIMPDEWARMNEVKRSA